MSLALSAAYLVHVPFLMHHLSGRSSPVPSNQPQILVFAHDLVFDFPKKTEGIERELLHSSYLAQRLSLLPLNGS